MLIYIKVLSTTFTLDVESSDTSASVKARVSEMVKALDKGIALFGQHLT